MQAPVTAHAQDRSGGTACRPTGPDCADQQAAVPGIRGDRAPCLGYAARALAWAPFPAVTSDTTDDGRPFLWCGQGSPPATSPALSARSTTAGEPRTLGQPG